ncbi:MAG: dipeptide epimerase [Planctomycetota bacterium]
MKLATHRFELPLKHTFTISRSSVDVQPTLVVELSDGAHSGFGEATTNTYYEMTYDRMEAALDSVRGVVESTATLDPPTLWEAVAPQLSDCPFALCALDEAAHDLWGKQQGAPVYQLWGLDTASTPPSNYTIGIDSVEVMVEKLNEMPGWPVYKIKLGTDRDLEIVRELRKHTDARFRIDANCGWTADQAIELSTPLKELGVEFLEQPLPAADRDGAAKVFEQSALPVIADESCITEADVARCRGLFHGINIKLMKCGGLTPARRMIDQARSFGLQVMVGCMTESTVGISAIAQLLPLLDYVDMDGPALLAQDIAEGARVDRGVCSYPATNGNGVTLTAQPNPTA